MRELFALQVKCSDEVVELCYPVSAAGYGALVGLLLLGLLYPAIGFSPTLHPIWLVILDLTILGVAVNAVRLMWLSTVRFDLGRDQVRHGLRTIGKVSEIQSIEPTPDERAALQVVFLDDGRQVRRWPVPGVQARQASELGRLLADELRVPFHHPASRDGG
jgi:hypothetical protein